MNSHLPFISRVLIGLPFARASRVILQSHLRKLCERLWCVRRVCALASSKNAKLPTPRNSKSQISAATAPPLAAPGYDWQRPYASLLKQPRSVPLGLISKRPPIHI